MKPNLTPTLCVTFIPQRVASFCQRPLFVLLVAFWVLLSLPHTTFAVETFKVEGGLLELSNWKFERDGIVRLDGQWEVFPNRFLEPNNLNGDSSVIVSQYAEVPSVWSGKGVTGDLLSPKGHATFRVRIVTGTVGGPLCLRLINIHSAYTLWINGNLVVKSGTVGEGFTQELPYHRLRLINFISEQPEIEVMLQVSNYHYRSGGITSSLMLGLSEDIFEFQMYRWGVTLFLTGCLLIMGLYHLAIFILRPKGLSVLLFGLYCLLWVANGLSSSTSDLFLLQLFPQLSWAVLHHVDLISFYLSVPVLLYFLRCLYPQEIAVLACRIILVAALFFTIITLLLPIRSFSHLVPIFFLITIGYIVYILVMLILAFLRKRNGAAMILFGLSILGLAGINDMLHDMNIVHTAYITPFGVLAFILCQCLTLSTNFSKAFSSVEHLSFELGETNKKLTRLNNLKDEFLANTTHELRTPLNGMIGLAESLLTRPESCSQQEATGELKTIIASGKRLSNLIDDILDFSRLKHRDIHLNYTVVDIRTAVDVVVSVLSPLLGNKSLQLLNHIDSDIPRLHADEDRIQQILYNLIGNAIKYTDSGKVIILADVRDGFVYISVEDTGIGISPDQLDTVFMSYEQDTFVSAKGYGGTGLGLAIVEKLVKLHGGSIYVKSKPGAGSTFTFSMPISAVPSEGEKQLKRHPQRRRHGVSGLVREQQTGQPLVTKFTKESVLVVDDDPVNLQVVGNHLESAAIEFTTISDGVSTLSEIDRQGAPALLLLDIMMPQMDGYEVCRRLRKRWSQAELPIIFLTARSGLDNLVKGFEIGGNDYLIKPFSNEELIARVQTQLQVKAAYRTLKENAVLKREIARRKRTEINLKLMQQRLSRVLDSIKDAILVINENFEVNYSNAECLSLLGYESAELLGRPLRDIFEGESFNKTQEVMRDLFQDGQKKSEEKHYREKLLTKELQLVELKVTYTLLEVEQEQLVVFILQLLDKNNVVTHSAALTFIEELNQARQKLQEIEGMLEIRVSAGSAETISNDFKLVRTTLYEMERSLGGSPNNAQRKRLSVTAMNLALEYWQCSTGLEKSDLAERSGIWNVYMNHNGFVRTQTLDKYLDLNRLPQHPRWQKIQDTIEYVLHTCDLQSPEREKLGEYAFQLKFSN